MPIRKRSSNWKRLPPIELNLDNPIELEIWKYSQLMTHDGKARDWVVKLLAADVSTRAPVSDQDLYVPTDGFVYLMKASNGLYRIGKSKDPSMRLSDHQSKNRDVKLEIVHLISCDNYHAAELMLHSRFENQRIGRKEWFRLTDENVECIKAIEHLEAIPNQAASPSTTLPSSSRERGS